MSDEAETSKTTDPGLTLSSSLPSPPIVSQCKSTSSASPPVTSHVAVTPSSSGSHRVSHTRFPVRVGISWVKGEKLEAMDFSRTWYPSKIVDIDEEQKVVLIHFEGWNQRYDEWVPMESDKLRPVTRHSERKDKGPKKRRIHPHPIYRAGEQVLAKWTDCKKYPAKINRMMEDGSYEVNFYDGVSCLIQAMNIQPLPEEMKNMKSLPLKSPPSLKPKVSFKSIKVSLPDCVKKRVEQHAAEKKKTELQMAEVSRKKDEPQLSGIIKKKVESPVTESVPKKVDQKPQEIIKKKEQQSAFLDGLNKKMEQVASQTEQKTERLSEEMMQTTETNTSSSSKKLLPPKVFIKRVPDKDSFSCHLRRSPLKSTTLKKEQLNLSPEPPKPDIETIDSKSEKVESEAEPVKSKTTTTTENIELLTSLKQDIVKNSQDTESMDISEKTLNCDLKTEPVVEKVVSLDNTNQNVLTISKCPRRPGRRRSKKRCFSQIKVGSKKIGLKSSHEASLAANIKIKSPKHKTACLQSIDSSFKNDPATEIIPAIAPLQPPQKYIPSKAFIVEEDHNPFKCHFEGCTKAFRKESLLTSHIKYYHTSIDTPTSSTATTAIASSHGSSTVQSPISVPGSRKRRKKTSSICSTDSDVSIGSREKLLLSKRYRHDSEVSITAGSPVLLSKDIWADVHHQRCSQSVHGDMVETEEEEFEKDVVNCICGQRETNGLMIQCDICMCWQHFACMDTNNSGEPPANYVCYICENTPGVRDSCKYLYDLSWEKKGDLPSFPFVMDAPKENLKSLAIECHEISSTLHKLKAALHSTRRQIKISKEEDDHEFQLWQTDWDNWTKPDEDLTLTPRSVDPDPSPTPSTFLFPSAPSTSLNNVSSSATISSVTPTYSGPSPACATIEVASGLSPLSNTSLICGLDRSNKTCEIPSSENLSAAHKGHPLSFKEKADNLVCGLIHGPGGDADSFSKMTYKSDLSKIEPLGVAHHEDTLINGNNTIEARDTLQSSSLISTSLSLAKDGSKKDLNVDRPLLCESQMESSSAIRSDQGVYTSADQKQMDRDDLIDGQSLKQLSELYVDVSGVQSHSTVYTDDQDNDTDTAEESVDPYKNCEHNLLVHVTKVHASVEKHLEVIEQQIAELENSNHSNSTALITEENVLNDIPALKKSLGKLARNLYKVQRLCLHN